MLARLRGVFLLVSLCVASLAGAAQNTSSVRLFVSGVSAEELATATVVRWQEGVQQRVAAERGRSVDANWLDVAAECEPGSTFVITTTQHIGAVAMPQNCLATERVVLHPRASIAGRFAAHASVSRLPAFGLAKTKCATIPFAIERSKITPLSVPADCGVVSLAVAKLAPVLITPESLSSSRTHQLGDVQLKHGSSLLGRVRSAVDNEPVAELTAIVLRSNDLDRLRGEFNESALQPLARGATDRHGWVSFYALPPAEIVLALRRPNQTFPELTERYLLDAAGGLVIDDLDVSAPASVAVRLQVPESLAGQLVLTNIELSPDRGNRWPQTGPIVVPALTDGTPSMLEAPPGAWKIAAIVRPKEGFVHRSAVQSLTLAPGSHHEVTLQVNGGIYQGRVVRGGDGVKGVLNLRSEDASTFRAATARSSDDGRFSVLLEGPGVYTLDFAEGQKGSIRFERYVEFEEPSKEVEIRLPNGRIRGKVVYENGVPAANAGVSARQHSSAGTKEAHAAASNDGSFTIESVPGGSWIVAASMKGVDGDRVEVALLEDSTADGVMLVVRVTAEVGIRVVDARGLSVANAFVIVELPATYIGADPDRGLRRTDADGVVRLHLPAAAKGAAANVLVSTADDRLSAARVRLDPDVMATVRFPARTGELRLKRAKGKWSDVGMARLVAEDGSSIPVPTARGAKAYVADDLIRFANVPAGSWRYIEALTPMDSFAIRTLDFLRVRPSAEFTVQPGVVNEVTVPQ